MSTHDENFILLFSYGTLRQENVQRATFGRLLEGREDMLLGYAVVPLKIDGPAVIAASGSAIHTIARPTGDPSDTIPGTVFRITPTELAAADAYEVDACTRVEVTLKSGARAFAYVSALEQGTKA